MNMLSGIFVTIAALTLSRAPTAAAASPRPIHLAPERRPAVRPEELYSLRARRRFATYLRLRLLELREEGLSRAADAIEGRISVESLLRRNGYAPRSPHPGDPESPKP
jgi:hypothetical protein